MDLAALSFPVLFKPSYLFCAAAMMVFALSSPSLFAQQKIIDSLLARLKSHPAKDSVSLNLLNKISFAYAPVDHQKGMAYADMALSMAMQSGNKHAGAEALFNKGQNYDYAGDLKKGSELDLQSLRQFEQLGDKIGIIKCCLDLSKNYYAVADYFTGLQYAQQAVDLSTELRDKKWLAQSLNKLGINYVSMADYPKGVTCFLQQLKIVEQLNDKVNIAKALGNIGLIYYYLKKYPEALAYDARCIKVLREMNDQVWVAAALNNIGGVYLEMHDYEKAIKYNQQALDINLVVKSKKGMGNDLMDMGAAYYQLHNYPEAFKCMQQSVAIYDSLDAKNNLSLALGHLAGMYINTPVDALQKAGVDPATRFSKALQFQQKAVRLASEARSLGNEAEQWKKLSTVYEKQNNYREALNSYRNYSALSDSVFNDKKREEITRLGIQYEFDKREADLKTENAKKEAKASAELSRQRVIKNASIIVGLVLIVSGFTTFAFYKRRKDSHEKQKDAEFRVQVAETEMKALRSQLNPHFIFNSLNSIGDYIARHDKETADIYLVKFAKLMRMILENSEQKTISLEDDLTTLELYIQLEALRLGHKLLYEIVIDEEIDTEIAMVPPMILQPFVENSIWHGISPKNGSGKIIIRVKKDGDMIEYMVEDNGIGRTGSAALKSGKNGSARKSFGIKVIQSRINIINEAKQTNAKVELTDLDEGTRVSIRLPYELKF
ncbi:MAG TPA: tetratricopeptide repeat protein [Mucilaginibacter sp.]|nr:tetratricopeptide repeat protein [Mucilaginibacter sp.]